MKNNKIKYFSWSELNAQEARGRRHGDPEPSSISVVDHQNYIKLWAAHIKKVDPDGKEGREIAAKYSD